MGLVRADLEGNMSDEERASRKEWIDRTESNDKWAKKIFQPIGILLTSHTANRPYMKACLESHAKLGYWTTLAYDNYIDPSWPHAEHDRWMPTKDMMDLIDMFIMPHHQCWGGVLYPYFWLLKWGASAMQQFEYIYCTNSDFVLEKPEGFNDLLALMGDADIMTSGPDYDTDGHDCAANTAGFIVKSKALLQIVQHMQDHFIPWDVYEKWTNEIGNAEGRFGKAIRDLKLKKVNVVAPNDDMLKVPGKGTWYDLIGFRHIHAEHNYTYRNKGIPPHYKFLDKRFMGDEYNQIAEYHATMETLDRITDKEMVEMEKIRAYKILENWWAK